MSILASTAGASLLGPQQEQVLLALRGENSRGLPRVCCIVSQDCTSSAAE